MKAVIAPRFRPPPAPVDGERPRMHDQVESRQHLKCPLLQGVMAHTSGGSESVHIAPASTVRLRHGLGRTPQGWMLVDDEFVGIAPADVRRTAWDEHTITLVTVGEAQIKVWVF